MLLRRRYANSGKRNPLAYLYHKGFSLQLSKFYKKGYQIYAIHVSNLVEDKGPKMEDYKLVLDYAYVFLDEVLGLFPKRDIDFMRASQVSRAPYKMSTLQLIELKMKLQELMDKNYIMPGVSPWGVPMLFVKKKDGTLWIFTHYR